MLKKYFLTLSQINSEKKYKISNKDIFKTKSYLNIYIKSH